MINMLFYVLGLVYGLIIFISLFGNYKGEELERHKRDWKNIFKEDYYG